MQVKTFSQRMNEALLIRQKSAAEIYRETGISESIISQYRSGLCKPKQRRLEALAISLGVSEAWLMGFDVPMEREHHSTMTPLDTTGWKMIPLLGPIACGTPLFADGNVRKMIRCPDEVSADFSLICKGDSMVGARIMDGDIVYIRRQDDVDDGQIAAIIIPVSEGEAEATLKRVYHNEDGSITLVAENPKYRPMTMTDAHIEGLAVAFLSSVD